MLNLYQMLFQEIKELEDLNLFYNKLYGGCGKVEN